MYSFFIHKFAIGCVQVAMMSVCLPTHTSLKTSNRNLNNLQPQAPPK